MLACPSNGRRVARRDVKVVSNEACPPLGWEVISRLGLASLCASDTGWSKTAGQLLFRLDARKVGSGLERHGTCSVHGVAVLEGPLICPRWLLGTRGRQISRAFEVLRGVLRLALR